MTRLLRVLASVAVALAAATVDTADAAGVCYSPFYSSDYTSTGVSALLTRDFKQIAAQGFDAVRTYHAQFFGINVVGAARAAGIKVAIGIQMVDTDGGVYAYLESDIQAAITAAKTAPDSVAAIYAGNENLQNGNWGSTSAADIISVIQRVKSALQGTAGANVPVGTVQRLNEWLTASDAASVAAASDVVGANIYPFFTTGGAADMQGTLSNQWSKMTAIYGGKARLTETGWPSQGSSSPYGNAPTLANAAKYFSAFVAWTQQAATSSPFYFMMFDVPTATGDDYEQHFGVATSSNVIKFTVDVGAAQSSSSSSVASSSTSASKEAGELRDLDTASTTATVTAAALDETSAPTEAPTTETPTPTTGSPTPTMAPALHDGSAGSSSAGSHDQDGETIEFPTSGSQAMPHGSSTAGSGGDTSVGDGSAGFAPAPTTQTVPVSSPAPTAAAATPAPAATTLTPQAQAELDAQEANSKVARDVSGKTGNSFYLFASCVGAAGVASMVVIGVYMRRRNDVDGDETRTVAASSVDRFDPRGSTPSVYDDPLGTRFSSIVMLTPNGDGVCIL